MASPRRPLPWRRILAAGLPAVAILLGGVAWMQWRARRAAEDLRLARAELSAADGRLPRDRSLHDAAALDRIRELRAAGDAAAARGENGIAAERYRAAAAEVAAESAAAWRRAFDSMHAEAKALVERLTKVAASGVPADAGGEDAALAAAESTLRAGDSEGAAAALREVIARLSVRVEEAERQLAIRRREAERAVAELRAACGWHRRRGSESDPRRIPWEQAVARVAAPAGVPAGRPRVEQEEAAEVARRLLDVLASLRRADRADDAANADRALEAASAALGAGRLAEATEGAREGLRLAMATEESALVAEETALAVATASPPPPSPPRPVGAAGLAALRERVDAAWKSAEAHLVAEAQARRCGPCGWTGACAACQGTGGSRGRCTACDGKGNATGACAGCSGRGGVTCAPCGASGQRTMTCDHCNGIGGPACRTCRGAGGTPCTRCKGEGVVRCVNPLCPGAPKGCFACENDGFNDCRLCKTAKTLPCAACRGTGVAGTCVGCNGRKTVARRCESCGGAGRAPCGTCAGRGRIATVCGTCDRGTATLPCGTCRGKRVCPGCAGSGRVSRQE